MNASARPPLRAVGDLPAARTAVVRGGGVSALGCTAEAAATEGVVHLRMLVDRTSIETFANHGALSMTSCFLPKEQTTGVELYAKDGDVNIRSPRVAKL